MLKPLSKTYFQLRDGAEATIIPKLQITDIRFDSATGETELDRVGRPTLRFLDTEANLVRTLTWRDF